MTTFKSEAGSPENALLDEFDTIDLHHGPYSANQPYTVLEVIGTSLTEKVKAELGQYGFDEFCSTMTGFRAVRPVQLSKRFTCKRFTSAYFVTIFVELVVYVAVQYGVIQWVSTQDSDLLTIFFFDGAFYAALIAAAIGFFVSGTVLQSQKYKSGRSFLLASLAALLTYFPLHGAFLRAFIKYWEWQHDGRRMKFTMWADERAMPSVLLVVPVVFLFLFWLMERRES